MGPVALAGGGMRVRGSVRRIVEHGGWGLVNVSVVILVAIQSAVDDFGLFGIAYSAAMVLSGVCIATSGEVLAVARGGLLRGGASNELGSEEVRDVAGRALGVVVVLAICAPVICGVILLPFGFRDTDPTLAVLFVAFSPVTVFADGLRSIFYGMRRLDDAVWLSRTWIMVTGALSVCMYLFFGFTPGLAIIAWGVGGIGSVAVGIYLGVDRVRFSGTPKAEWARRVGFAFEQLATAGPPNATVPLAAALIGLPAAAVMRGLQTLYGPLNVVLAGLRLFVTPMVSEEPSERRVLRAGAVLGCMAIVITAGLTGLLAVVPQLGRWLLGENWTDDTLLVVGFGVGRCAVGLVLGALVVLRSRDAVRSSSRLRVASAVSFLLCFTVFASIDLRSAVWASTLSSLVMAVLWWAAARRRMSTSVSSQDRSGGAHGCIEDE